MENSIIIARIIFVAYLASGIALLNGNLDLKKTYQEMEKYRLFTVMLGMFVLLLGMLIISFHNYWIKDWPVLITVIGWILFVEGFLYIINPALLLNLYKKLPKSQIGWGLVTLALSAVFGYFSLIA